jgi:hypothetical protein
MRFFGYWTVLVALSISAVAAYYSIVGLVAIFAAAAIPIIIMGSVLEVGKLTSAVWLHLYWKKAPFLIKSYLTIAVLLLMFITSMGIFGFLSKAHIEQNAVAIEGKAQLERIASDIIRGEDIIARAETKIQKLDTQDESLDSGLQDKIATEEARIETVYTRLNEALTSLEQTLNDSVAPYQTQIEQSEVEITQIAEYVRDDKIKALQGLIGAKQDGQYGPKTAAKVEEYRLRLIETRDSALQIVTTLRNEARTERQRLRTNAETTVDQSNQLINRLREQIGTATNDDVEVEIQEQRDLIKATEAELDIIFEKKYELEAEARQLEAEVGPVKYIAELIYGNNADKNALEEAVRWVIIVLVIVFDPLAVVLVISGITIIEHARRPVHRESGHERTDKSTDSNIQDGDVEHNERDREADDEKDLSRRSVVESTKEQIPDSNQTREQTDTMQDAGGSSEGPAELENVPMVYEDETGKYTVDTSGKRNYIVNEEQEKLNVTATTSKKTQQETKIKIEEVVSKMKAEGLWPNSPVPTERVAIREVLNADKTGELEDLLEKADPDTRREVYNTIINEYSQRKP